LPPPSSDPEAAAGDDRDPWRVTLFGPMYTSLRSALVRLPTSNHPQTFADRLDVGASGRSLRQPGHFPSCKACCAIAYSYVRRLGRGGCCVSSLPANHHHLLLPPHPRHLSRPGDGAFCAAGRSFEPQQPPPIVEPPPPEPTSGACAAALLRRPVHAEKRDRIGRSGKTVAAQFPVERKEHAGLHREPGPGLQAVDDRASQEAATWNSRKSCAHRGGSQPDGKAATRRATWIMSGANRRAATSSARNGSVKKRHPMRGEAELAGGFNGLEAAPACFAGTTPRPRARAEKKKPRVDFVILREGTRSGAHIARTESAARFHRRGCLAALSGCWRGRARAAVNRRACRPSCRAGR